MEEATKIESYCAVPMPNAICLVNYSLSNNIIWPTHWFNSPPYVEVAHSGTPVYDPFPYQGSSPSSFKSMRKYLFAL